MKKVNLLKPELGGIKKTFIPKFLFGRIQKFLLLLGLISFLMGIFIIIQNIYQKKYLYQIDNQYSEAEKLKQQIGVLSQEKDKIDKEINLLDGYLKREIIWSDKLSRMRNLIPKEAWLAKLSYEKRPGKEQSSLYLAGGIIPEQKENAISVLSNFINQLKENREFSSGFDNPVLSDVRTEVKDNMEIMAFMIEIPIGKLSPRLLNETAR